MSTILLPLVAATVFGATIPAKTVEKHNELFQKFWGTEAMHQLAIAAYNLCVLLQRRLGQLEKCELNTLRWKLFGRAAVWSWAQGKPTLKLAVREKEQQGWWREILSKLTALPNCNAVESLQA